MLCQYMTALVHLLQHPLRDQLMEEWKKNETKDFHWIKWQNLASDFYTYLHQKKVIESSWTSAFLLDNIPFKNMKFKEIVFDLGLDMDKIEAALIQQIASQITTKVLMPFSFDDMNNNKMPLYARSCYSDFPGPFQTHTSQNHENRSFLFKTAFRELKNLPHRWRRPKI